MKCQHCGQELPNREPYYTLVRVDGKPFQIMDVRKIGAHTVDKSSGHFKLMVPVICIQERESETQ